MIDDAVVLREHPLPHRRRHHERQEPRREQERPHRGVEAKAAPEEECEQHADGHLPGDREHGEDRGRDERLIEQASAEHVDVVLEADERRHAGQERGDGEVPEAHRDVVVERVAEHHHEVDDRRQHEAERHPGAFQADAPPPDAFGARRVQELAGDRDGAIGRLRSVVLHRAPPAGPSLRSAPPASPRNRRPSISDRACRERQCGSARRPSTRRTEPSAGAPG